jgi:hypothetical protein
LSINPVIIAAALKLARLCIVRFNHPFSKVPLFAILPNARRGSVGIAITMRAHNVEINFVERSETFFVVGAAFFLFGRLRDFRIT